jgi:hypothetical protein
MSVGFDLGYLKSSSTGLSYINQFSHLSGTTNRSYSSEAFKLANAVAAYVSPAQNIPASTIPSFPTISTSLNKTTGVVGVTATGGNVSVNILVFIR